MASTVIKYAVEAVRIPFANTVAGCVSAARKDNMYAVRPQHRVLYYWYPASRTSVLTYKVTIKVQVLLSRC